MRPIKRKIKQSPKSKIQQAVKEKSTVAQDATRTKSKIKVAKKSY